MEKSRDNHYKRLERVVYVSLWGIVALIPLIEQVYEYLTGADVAIEFGKVVRVWLFVLPFFVMFWLHDFMLLRLLIKRGAKFKVLYVALTIAMIVGINSAICLSHKWHRHERKGVDKELLEKNMPDSAAVAQVAENAKIEETNVSNGDKSEKVERRKERGPRGPINMFVVTNTIFALFVVSINIAVKLYFRGLSNRRRIARLEAENTTTRLQFLKYQINPHFFMNTLNNIHALIDIDAEKAQSVVVDLSKMMRYVLYEIDKDEVTLQQEVDFLNNYIELMRIRLRDNVKIDVAMPEGVDDVKLPPLLFIPFVENIFKHGISYREPSMASISLRVDAGYITFGSRNSNHANNREDAHHGIGLENLRRRLDLLYGEDYRLRTGITADGTMYEVELVIPIEREFRYKEKTDKGE